MTNINRNFLALAGISVALSASAPAFAQTADATAAPAAPTVPAWLNKISLGGDLRLRLSQINRAGNQNTQEYLRARIGFTGKVNDSVTANLRLSTSDLSAASTNTTTNVEMTDESARKPYFVDVGSLDWKAMDTLVVTGGRSVNPFFTAGKNELVWAADLNFEGANVKWAQEMGALKPFATVSYNKWTDAGANKADLNMIGAQIGTGFKSDLFTATVAYARYTNNNLKDTVASTFGSNSATNFRGNTVNGTGATATFANEFKQNDVEAELGMDIIGLPFTVYGAWVKNDEASDFNQGMLGGIRVGKLKDAGSWSLDYNYRDLAKDAVIGALTDATSFGSGADVLGSRVTAQYMAASGLTLTANGMWGQNKNQTSSNPGTTWERYMLEAIATF